MHSYSGSGGTSLSNWAGVTGRSVSANRAKSAGRAGLASLTRQSTLTRIAGQT